MKKTMQMYDSLHIKIVVLTAVNILINQEHEHEYESTFTLHTVA